MLKSHLYALLALMVSVVSPVAAQLPFGWRTLYDTPSVHDTLNQFAPMPPGWHLTTNGSGGVVYDMEWVATGRYSLEWEVFVFPTASPEPVGIFLAGRGLASREPNYHVVKFTAQGMLSVTRRAGVESRIVVPAALAPSFVAPSPSEPGKNILRITVDPDSVRVALNGTPALAFAAVGGADGHFGFRVGTGTNLHVTRLDLTRPLAPPRSPGS